MISCKDEREEFLRAEPEDCLIFAGPGTGKTTCLLNKFKKLIDKGFDYRDIVLFTFTRYAREDLVDKLGDRTDRDLIAKNIFTFASFVHQIYESLVENKSEQNLFSGTYEGEQDVYTRLIYAEKKNCPLDSSNPHKFHLGKYWEFIQKEKEDDEPFKINEHPKLSAYAKRNRYSMINMLSKIRYFRDAVERGGIKIAKNELFYSYLKKSQNDVNPDEKFNKYSVELKNANRIDSNDVAIEVLKKLKQIDERKSNELPEILKKRKLIMVDEMQDQSPIDFELILTLKELWNAKLIMVGDVNQTIYFFRLANPLTFDKPPFNAYKRYHLTDNYRSIPDIVQHVNNRLPAKRHEKLKEYLYQWDRMFENPIEDESLIKFDEFLLTLNPCVNGKDVGVFEISENMILDKINELERKKVNNIAFLAFSKRDNSDLNKFFKILAEKWKSSRIYCYYPNLYAALMYSRFYLLDYFANSSVITKQEFEDEFIKIFKEENKRFNTGLAGSGNVMSLREFINTPGIKMLIDHFMKSVFNGESEISFRQFMEINVREIALTFLNVIRNVKHSCIFINLHQIKGLQFDAVFYFPGMPNIKGVEHEIQRLNLDYVARSRAERFLYIIKERQGR